MSFTIQNWHFYVILGLCCHLFRWASSANNFCWFVLSWKTHTVNYCFVSASYTETFLDVIHNLRCILNVWFPCTNQDELSLERLSDLLTAKWPLFNFLLIFVILMLKDDSISRYNLIYSHNLDLSFHAQHLYLLSQRHSRNSRIYYNSFS
jgi:hypothetical protein